MDVGLKLNFRKSYHSRNKKTKLLWEDIVHFINMLSFEKVIFRDFVQSLSDYATEKIVKQIRINSIKTRALSVRQT